MQRVSTHYDSLHAGLQPKPVNTKGKKRAREIDQTCLAAPLIAFQQLGHRHTPLEKLSSFLHWCC